MANQSRHSTQFNPRRLLNMCLCAFVIAILCFLQPTTARAQRHTAEFGLRAAAAVPTTNFASTVGPGVAGGIYAGWWNSDRVILVMQASFDQFSAKTADDGSDVKGAFLPVELGIRYHSAGGLARGFYVSTAGGVIFQQGDFSGQKASISIGAGYTVPLSRGKLMIDATYRSEISDPFNSYLLLGMVFGFGI
jgi:hypothetical protein